MAGLLTGSAAMFAEAAHSVADTATELLLLTALRRSARRPDRRHPFGYGKERFFWALIAAVSIFVSGAVFAIIEGVRTILGGQAEQTLVWIAYAVLAVSFVLEGISWLQAVRQVRAAAREESTTALQWLRTTDDPTVRSVFFEDSAALVGLLLAFGGVGLNQLTGSSFWDGLASLLAGSLPRTGAAHRPRRTQASAGALRPQRRRAPAGAVIGHAHRGARGGVGRKDRR